MLDSGVHATLEDLARAKGVNATYVSRILRLTLLAPDIVDAILNRCQPAALQLDDLLRFSVSWVISQNFRPDASELARSAPSIQFLPGRTCETSDFSAVARSAAGLRCLCRSRLSRSHPKHSPRRRQSESLSMSHEDDFS